MSATSPTHSTPIDASTPSHAPDASRRHLDGTPASSSPPSASPPPATASPRHALAKAAPPATVFASAAAASPTHVSSHFPGRPTIDAAMYPHIMSRIIAFAPLEALLKLRATCRKIRGEVEAGYLVYHFTIKDDTFSKSLRIHDGIVTRSLDTPKRAAYVLDMHEHLSTCPVGEYFRPRLGSDDICGADCICDAENCKCLEAAAKALDEARVVVPELDIVRVFNLAQGRRCVNLKPVSSPINVNTAVYVTDMTDKHAAIFHPHIGNSPSVVFHARFNPNSLEHLVSGVSSIGVDPTHINMNVIFAPTPGLAGTNNPYSDDELDPWERGLYDGSWPYDAVQRFEFELMSNSTGRLSYVGYEDWPVEMMPVALRQEPWEDPGDIKAACSQLLQVHAEDWAEPFKYRAGWEPGWDPYQAAKEAAEKTSFITTAEFKQEWRARHPALLSMVLHPL